RWTRPMLGKTGTTQNNRSAGFVGATPQYSAAVLVWPDGSRPSPICDSDPPRLCGNGNIFGGKVPARTWFQAMVPLHQGLPAQPMPPTDDRYVEGGGVRVPDVIGQGENQARLTLERAGFKVETTRVDARRPAGTVISQEPARALPGDVVTLVISTGKPPRTAVRPTRPSGPDSPPSAPPASREPQPSSEPSLTEPPAEPTEPTEPPTGSPPEPPDEPPTEPPPEEGI
ncbi:MAG: PASTA domain-containing protein, partial [Pseudonocardiaceae bacterium]